MLILSHFEFELSNSLTRSFLGLGSRKTPNHSLLFDPLVLTLKRHPRPSFYSHQQRFTLAANLSLGRNEPFEFRSTHRLKGFYIGPEARSWKDIELSYHVHYLRDPGFSFSFITYIKWEATFKNIHIIQPLQNFITHPYSQSLGMAVTW